MKTIGLFYAEGKATAAVVAKIEAAFGKSKIKLIPIETVRKSDFEAYDNMIMGVSTWFDGELPAHWDEVVPQLKTVDLSSKRVAVFGLGDQLGYPDNFVDGIGILAYLLESRGAELVGTTACEGYKFNHSKAIRGDRFLGLALDVDTQSDLTDARIKNWVGQLESEFK